MGIETRRLEFQEYGGIQIAHKITVLHKDALAMLIRGIEISAAGTLPSNTFDVPGHKWNRAFTDEVR